MSARNPWTPPWRDPTSTPRSDTASSLGRRETARSGESDRFPDTPPRGRKRRTAAGNKNEREREREKTEPVKTKCLSNVHKGGYW